MFFSSNQSFVSCDQIISSLVYALKKILYDFNFQSYRKKMLNFKSFKNVNFVAFVNIKDNKCVFTEIPIFVAVKMSTFKASGKLEFFMIRMYALLILRLHQMNIILQCILNPLML